MEAHASSARAALAPGSRARGAARANLGGALSMVLTCYGAPGSVLLTLFLQDWLRADKWQIGLVMTMTFLGPTFEPVGAYLAERLGRRRPLFLAAFLCNRVPFLLLAGIPLLASPDAHRDLGIALVLTVVAVTRVPASLGNPAWWSWMADLVPERRRGLFFGWRTQMASTVSALSFVVGMMLLQTCGGMNNRALVSALFAVGAGFGIADILMYVRVPEPPLRDRRGHGGCAVGAGGLAPSVRDFAAPFRLPGFRRLIVGMGLWSFSANLVMPFLPVYQNGEMLAGQRLGLGLSWLFLAVLNVAGSVGGVLTSRWWARWSDRFGARSLMVLGSGYLFVNLAYLVVGPGRWLGVLVPVALISGALNAAWTVSANQMLLTVAPRAKRSFFVSAYNATNGLLMAGGPLLGGLLADRLPVLGWHLPGGLPCCYFHVLLALAAAGGVTAMTVLAGVPTPAPAGQGDTQQGTKAWWARVGVSWEPNRDGNPEAGQVDNRKEYATI